MKKIIILFSLLAVVLSSDAQGGTWTWVKGSNASGDLGNIGTVGVASTANYPEGRYQAGNWIDLNGNLWIFGGLDNTQSPRNDLWKYTPSTNTWEWINGPITPYSNGVYGTQGVPGPSNIPGARGWGMVTWTDQQGRLWLHGGYGYDALGNYGPLDDLWMYNIATNEWTWMQGSTIGSSLPDYGSLQVPAASNTPGGRYEDNTAWVTSDGSLWTFGGEDGNYYNDMWKFNPGTNMWTWMSGPQGQNTSQDYGAMGVQTALNLPPARGTYTRWQDASDNLYIYAGINDFSPTTTFSDVWRYSTTDNEWTWIGGDSLQNDPGYFDQTCTPGASLTSGGRYENRTAQMSGCSDIFWTFGGFDLNNYTYNDLWNFNTVTAQWTWVSGDSTINSIGNFGNIGVSAATNMPPSRGGSCLWVDHTGTIWLWGGFSSGFGGKYDDLWTFVPDTACLHSSLFITPIGQLSDSVICPGDTARLFFNGGHILGVSPAPTSVILPDSAHALFFPTTTTTYSVILSGLCGSIDTLRYPIAISNLIPVAETAAICGHDSVIFYGHVITTPGIYRDTVNNPSGCDSIVILTVSSGSSSTSNLTRGLCPGSAINFNGQIITAPGIYHDTLTGSLGCDSFVNLTVTIQTVLYDTINASICPGSDYFFNNAFLFATGTYQDTAVVSGGCDSITVLNLTVANLPVTNISQTICPGGIIDFNGQIITTAGFYTTTYFTLSGCDSTVDLTVTTGTILGSTVDMSICNGSSINYNGLVISTPGTYSDTLTAASGCDSVVTLVVGLSVSDTTRLDQNICSGDTIVFNGTLISAAGFYSATLTSATGCDSIVDLTLGISPAPVAGFSITPVGDTVQYGQITVTNTSANTDSVLWELNNRLIVLTRDSILPIIDTGNYCIRLIAISASGCVDTSDQCIYVFDNAFVMPDAFTPNGDGKNDVFYPVLLHPSTTAVTRFSIYNRWGQLVFDDPAQGWDGNYKGQPQPGDVYTYFVTVNLANSSTPGVTKEVARAGTVTLLR